MSEDNQSVAAETVENTESTETVASETVETAQPAAQEEISYHAVQKDGNITAIWEMRGRKHLRTIDPRSEEGRHLLGHHEPQAEGAAEASHSA